MLLRGLLRGIVLSIIFCPIWAQAKIDHQYTKISLNSIKPLVFVEPTELLSSIPWTIYKEIKKLEEDFWLNYQSGLRFKNYVQPIEGRLIYQDGSKKIEIPFDLLSALTSHLEKALKLQYAEFIFYPDLGHVHLLLPEKSFVRKNIEDNLKRKDLVFLYHAAELFEFKKNSSLSSPLVDDEWFRWRYYSRNFLGTMDPQQNLQVIYSNNSLYNTVRQVEGYEQVETLYFNAHQEGCFSYQAKSRRLHFDVSFLHVTL